MPTLYDGKYYKIRSACSGKVVTLTEKNWDGRKLGYPNLERKQWVVGYPGPTTYKWDITQWETGGGAEYRVWVNGAPDETLLDLKDENQDVGAWIWTNGPTHSSGQLWLFEEVPYPY
ncbi:hypothetical protein H0H93_002220 [Arthromyces matolae]|nr:hypothetical protein H0H93_002220 [Arthromyces matolae]